MITKLTSMTDFVFYMRNQITSELCKSHPKNFTLPKWKGSQDEMVKDMLAIDAIQWKLTGEYAKFLKQPLTLSMFVPCDDEGNVLEEPTISRISNFQTPAKSFESFQNDYKVAQSKVLFKSFKYSIKGNLHEVYNKKLDCGYIFGAMTGGTIESLANKDVVLSETALKQIYG